jgi:peptide/nickel transport system permease protein
VVLVSIAEPSVTTITLSIGIVSRPTIARLVRAEFRSLRERDFVLAARGLGYSSTRIVFLEILPNAMAPVIVTTSVMVATAILSEAALSFLGLGDPNLVSWGSMIGAGRDQLRTAWYLVALPGAALVLSVLALNLLGDGLTDALNPRARGR